VRRKLLAAGAAVAAAAGVGALVYTTAPAPAPLQPPSTAIPTTTPSMIKPCRIVDNKADATCTPGVRNPAVTQATIGSTICVSGWTATVRPPASFTNRLKAQQLLQYGLSGPLTDYEEDHLIPLEIGGAPRDARNLWPEHWSAPSGAHTKDAEENALHAAVCKGTMTLADAQNKILLDWTNGH